MDEETRKIISLFLQAFKRSQARAMSLNSALTWIMNLPPNIRAALTPQQIQEQIATLREVAAQNVQKQAVQLEQALQDDKHALLTLQAFASMHLRD